MSDIHRDRIGLTWAGAGVGLVLPTIITWIYFIHAAQYSPAVQQSVGLISKILQFAFPLLWVSIVLHEPLGWPRPSGRGVLTGIGFGVLVAAAGWLVYENALKGSAVFTAATAQIRSKTASFGIDSIVKYAALGAFYSLVHSLLEEYYWRWFVFGQLRRLLPRWSAIAISALGFMAHHVLVLSLFFGWWTWPTILFSLAVATGGVFWAWLYERTGSLYGPWLSHLVIDAGIFWIGYDLIGDLLTSTL